MAGLPTSITKQLRASGEIKNFNDTVQRARLLLSIEEQHSVVAVGSSGQGVQELEQRLGAQIEALSEQVAALARPTEVKKCFYCKEAGHLQRNCPKRRQPEQRKCYRCGKLGHLAKDCELHQENFNGVPANGRGNRKGIIEESSSPWMAPAVYVKKKTGEIRLCVDYRALNKQTTKDAYPLPLPDEVQDRLCGCTIFSTLDLRSGYWQVPIAPSDVEKTAFCPGPGLGLFHFKRMPFGLTGAPGSFQRLMDKVLRGLNFVTTYLDDVLVHSKTKDEHIKHLNAVFSRLKNAGLTLRGSKCHIGHDKVYYLGHVFSEQGMRPDEGKVRVVKEWPTPNNPSEVRQFLGLASYYRRCFFSLDVRMRPCFNLLKEKLTQAPILVYPQFGSEATPFILETDASDVGIAAVLQQDGHVIAYASRALSKSEKNYSVIQKECLAIVYGTKQFRHYLLGRSFTVLTDHAPLQWLSAQKMEGLLCRWALALQEYDFVVQYRKGSQNSNADALSRLPSCTVSATTAVVGVWEDRAALRLAQEQDSVLRKVIKALKTSRSKPTSWSEQPLRRYAQLWQQLGVTAVDGIACRRYSPGPCDDVIEVPLIPETLRKQALQSCHDVPSAGHQGAEKTFARLRQEVFWVNMARDVEEYCRNCVVCQRTKLLMPVRAPMQNVPIGRTWQMIAVDVLEVPLSSNSNRYLLVVQDYFTKWAEAIPMVDQTAATITNALVKLCSVFGLPEVIHSDQGRAFEKQPFIPQLEFRLSCSCLDDHQRFHLLLIRQLHSTLEHISISYGSSFPSCKILCMHEKLKNEAFHQQEAYDKTYKARGRKFKIGEAVWLSIPTAGKLQSRCEGMWIVKAIKSEVNLEISDGVRTKVVHVNRIRHRLQPQPGDDASPADDSKGHNSWVPPQIDHFIDEIGVPDNPSQERRYPQRTRNLPERYGPYLCHACGQA
ncbi:hypothetical protein EMCRGX_G017263 [Ephydatia muelleri]